MNGKSLEITVCGNERVVFDGLDLFFAVFGCLLTGTVQNTSSPVGRPFCCHGFAQFTNEFSQNIWTLTRVACCMSDVSVCSVAL